MAAAISPCPASASNGATTRGASEQAAQAAASSDGTTAGSPAARLGFVVARRRRRLRVPPAALAGLAQQSRDHQLPDEPGRLPRPRLRGGLRRVDRDARVRRIDERLGRRRLAVARALGRPALAPVGRRGRWNLAMRAREPDEAPGPRHDAIGVVAAAARREPSAAGVPMRDGIDQPGRLAHRGRRHPQVRERVPRVRIGTVLADHDVRPERGGQLGEQRAHARRATRPRRSSAPSGC